jgi:transposase-like protein
MIQHDQLRLQTWRLKILQEARSTGNVARTCRRYGISRKTFSRWLSRYNAEDVAGLRDRPCGPHHSPRATHPEIVQKILYWQLTSQSSRISGAAEWGRADPVTRFDPAS